MVVIQGKLSTFLTWVFELGKGALILAVLGLFIHYFVATILIIDGTSMEPNFKDKEYILVSRLSYLLNKPQRGDVVGLRFPGREQEKYIKRIIALPNETIKISGGMVFINGQRLKEDYLNLGTETLPDLEKTLSNDEYFVMGDNRGRSNDSRIWGTAPGENLIGKAIFIIYPLSEWNFVPKVYY